MPEPTYYSPLAYEPPQQYYESDFGYDSTDPNTFAQRHRDSSYSLASGVDVGDEYYPEPRFRASRPI